MYREILSFACSICPAALKIGRTVCHRDTWLTCPIVPTNSNNVHDRDTKN